MEMCIFWFRQNSQLMLGTTQKLARKPREAEVSMKKALAINVAVHGNIHPSIASCLEVCLSYYRFFARVYLFILLVVIADLRGNEATGESSRVSRTVGESIV